MSIWPNWFFGQFYHSKIEKLNLEFVSVFSGFFLMERGKIFTHIPGLDHLSWINLTKKTEKMKITLKSLIFLPARIFCESSVLYFYTQKYPFIDDLLMYVCILSNTHIILSFCWIDKYYLLHSLCLFPSGNQLHGDWKT